MGSRLLRMRLRLEEKGLFPKGRLALVTCYIAGLDAAVFLLRVVIGQLRPAYASYLDGWVSFLSASLAVLGLWLAKRWVSANLLWRVRTRLIVTYIFIGVVPLVLVFMLAGL